MSGIAIKVPNVNWSANNVGKVTFTGGEDTSSEAQKLYDDYISKSGRAGNSNLLMFISALVNAGLKDKISSIYYLASSSNNTEHVRYNIIDPSKGMTVGGVPVITDKGTKSNNSGFFDDVMGYNLANGLTAAFIISEAATAKGIDWGRDTKGATAFFSFGSWSGANDNIVRWANAEIIKDADDSDKSKKGVFILSGNGTQLTYLHNEAKAVKTVAALSTTGWNPRLFDYPSASNKSSATMKLYMVINNTLTESELNSLKTILMNYESLL